jgi:hypothetical protein
MAESQAAISSTKNLSLQCPRKANIRIFQQIIIQSMIEMNRKTFSKLRKEKKKNKRARTHTHT